MKKNILNKIAFFAFSFSLFAQTTEIVSSDVLQVQSEKSESGIKIKAQSGLLPEDAEIEIKNPFYKKSGPEENSNQNSNQDLSSSESQSQTEFSSENLDSQSENQPETSSENLDSQSENQSETEFEVTIPSSKRPKAPDSEKAADLDNTDPEAREKNPDIIKYGLETDISDLLETMTKNKDVRFADNVYDLFEETKSDTIREKSLRYFKAIEDPCVEDFAVEILDDPYDEKKSVVDACFSYIQTVKTLEAIPACKKLLESEAEEYFISSIETLGKIGGAGEAVYLSKYLDDGDLSLPERQALVRALGNLHADETYETLVDLAENEDENSFIRSYSAEAIGEMKNPDAVEVLVNLFESDDPNLRASVIKGLSNFENNEKAGKTIIQGVKDSHQKVRNESISAVKKLNITEADDYLIYRAKNDKESSVKKSCYETLAALGTSKGDEYLLSELKNKKTGDNTKLEISKALLANGKGSKEVASLAEETVDDNRRKQLRYALGKEMAKYQNSDFADVCLKYIQSKDNATTGTGLDIYAKGRYSSCDSVVKDLADKADLNAKTKNQMAIKAAKILGMDVDKMTEEKDAEREKTENLKNGKTASGLKKEASSSDSSANAK